MMNRLAPVLLLAASLTGQVTPIPYFAGTYTEEFDQLALQGPCSPRVFGNRGDFCTPGFNGVMVTYGWLVYVGYALYPANASNGFAGVTQGHGWFTFDEPVQRFGALFGTVGYLAGGTAKLYDANHVLIATEALTAPRGSWAWNGWDVGHGGTKIKFVELTANDPYNGGALICVENAQIDPSLGTITTTPMACGALPITATGLPVIGDTVTVSLGASSAFQGFVVGTPMTPQPIAACPSCQIGVQGFVQAGSQLILDVPNNPAFLDLSLAAQGFRFTGGPCLGFVAASDRVEVWVGLGQ